MVSTRRGAAAAGEVAPNTFSTPPDLKRKTRRRKVIETAPAPIQSVTSSSSSSHIPHISSPLSNTQNIDNSDNNNNNNTTTPSRNGNATAPSGTTHQASTSKFSSLRRQVSFSSSFAPSRAAPFAPSSAAPFAPSSTPLQGRNSFLPPVPTPFTDFLEGLQSSPARAIPPSSVTPAVLSPLRQSELMAPSALTQEETTESMPTTPFIPASDLAGAHRSLTFVEAPVIPLAEVQAPEEEDDARPLCILPSFEPCVTCGFFAKADIQEMKDLYIRSQQEISTLEAENSRLREQITSSLVPTQTPSSPTQTPSRLPSSAQSPSHPTHVSQTPAPATPSQGLFSRIGATIATPFRRILTPRRPSTPVADPTTARASQSSIPTATQNTSVQQTPSQGVKRIRQSDTEVARRDIKRPRQDSSTASSTALTLTTPVATTKRLRQPETEPAQRDNKRARLNASTSPQASPSIQTPSTLPRSLSMYRRATRAELDARPFGARRLPFSCGQRNEIKKTWELHMCLFERRRIGSLPKDVGPAEYAARMKAQVEYKTCQMKYPGYVARPAFCRAVMPLEGMTSAYEEKPYLPSHRERTLADPDYHQMLANYRELTGEDLPRKLVAPREPQASLPDPTPSPTQPTSPPQPPTLSTSPLITQTPGRTFCVPDESDTDESVSDIEADDAPQSTPPPPATAFGRTPPATGPIRRTPFATPVAPDGLSLIVEEDATPVPVRRETPAPQIESSSTPIPAAASTATTNPPSVSTSTKSGVVPVPTDPFFERFPTIDSLVDYYINADTSWVQEIGDEEVRLLRSYNGSRRAEAEHWLDHEDPLPPLDAAGREAFIQWMINVPEEKIMECARLMMQ